MVHMARTQRRRVRRFTVTLQAPDYDRLAKLAHEQEPPVSLRYVVECAVKQFLRRADDPQLRLEFDADRARGGNDAE